MRSISEESLILTRGGLKKGKDVTTEDFLWNGCEWQRPVETYGNYEKDSLRITTLFGVTLECSKEHRVWTRDGFKEAGKLVVGDYLRLDVVENEAGAKATKHLLSQYFDERCVITRCITAVADTEEEATLIQQALLMHGILSSVSRYKHGILISIISSYVRKFAERIGLISEQKREQLDTCVKYVKSLRFYRTKPTYWLIIKSIEENGVIPMVDFAMPGLNMYLANGLLVHNSGKTATASFLTAYAFFEVISKPHPARHWGLLDNQLISLTAVAASERQVQDGVFGNVVGMIENNEFFNQWFDINIRAGDIYCKSKNCKIRALSSSGNTSAGRSNYFVVFDELDLFDEDQAWNIYNTLSKSVVSFGKDGKYMSISSPRSSTGIMMTLYQRATQLDEFGVPLAPHIFAKKYPTWELNPNINYEELIEECKFDMDRFYADFACEPGMLSTIQFQDGVRLTSMPNVLFDPNAYSGKFNHVLAIDPAVKNDAFGMATAYYDFNRDMIVVDGVHDFRRQDGDARIDSNKVRGFIDRIIPQLNIDTVLHDVYMYPELLDHIENDLGVELIFHQVDKVDYDFWKDLQARNKTEVCHHDLMKYEAERLIVKRLATKDRVDHPSSGSKDMADCVASCISYLYQNRDKYMRARIIACRGF
jgi:hypothetical protein